MKYPTQIPFHVSGRVRSFAHRYFCMCADSLIRYRELLAQFTATPELDQSRDSKFEALERASIEAVVFAGMSLESTLYDLAACLFGNDFADDIDKLDPLGKFVALALAIDRKPPSRGAVTYQSIKSLITARNELVHHKSHSALETDWATIFDRSAREHKKHLAGVEACFRALVLLSLYFDGNIFEELRILPSFKNTENWKAVVPQALHEDVHACRVASNKERSASATA